MKEDLFPYDISAKNREQTQAERKGEPDTSQFTLSNQHEKPHLHLKSPSAITKVHSFTHTQIIDKSSTIQGVNVTKAPSPKLMNFLLINSCLQARQFQ